MSNRHVVVAALAMLATLLFALPGQAAPNGKRARYIVVLEDSVTQPGAVAGEQGRRFGAPVDAVFRHALKGYVASLTPAQAAAAAADARVAYVEADAVVQADTTQTGATWGLDRIDQRNRPLNGTYSYTNTGAGVTAYIIDTGIRFSHSQFGGRATSGFDAPATTLSASRPSRT